MEIEAKRRKYTDDQVMPRRFKDFHYAASAMCVNEVITALHERFKKEPRVSFGAPVGIVEYAYDIYVDDMRIVRISAAKKFQQDAVDDLIIGFTMHNSLEAGVFVSEVFFDKHRLMFMMMQYITFIMSGNNDAYLVDDDNNIVHNE